MGAAANRGLRRAGPGVPARSRAGGTALAPLGRGTYGAPSPGEGGGCTDGVCLVDLHGRPAKVSCGRCLPQSDGVELGGAEQWHLPRATADQQTGECADAALAVFRGVATGAAVRRPSLV